MGTGIDPYGRKRIAIDDLESSILRRLHHKKPIVFKEAFCCQPLSKTGNEGLAQAQEIEGRFLEFGLIQAHPTWIEDRMVLGYVLTAKGQNVKELGIRVVAQ